MQRNNSFIDILKVITLLLVVIGHNKYILPQISNTIVDYIFTSISPIIYSFHMPLFFMLSGGVYKICLNNGKYARFHDLVKNKYHRLVLPFIIISLFIVFPVYYLTSEQSIKSVFLQTITAQNAQHLWFILDLFAIFITLYYPIKYLSSYVLLPALLVINVLSYNSDIILIQRYLIYLLWFYIGYILLEKIITVKYSIINVLLLFVIFFVFYYCYNKIEYGNIIFRNIYFGLLSFIGCVSIISSSKLIINYIGYKILSSSIYDCLRRYSFEIYLYSCPVQVVFLSLYDNKILPPPINFIYSLFWYFLELFLAIILSIGFVKLLKFINLKK